jgi:membrane protease YdiL (CAAX protease family)
VLKKDAWNLKEGFNVFTNSLLVYITVYLFLIMFVWFQLGLGDGSSTTEIPFYLILLSQIPGMLLGIFPLWYINANKHSYEKLGFPTNKKKIISAFIIGILGGLGLIAINIFSGFINTLFYEIGLNFFDIQEYMDMETKAIRSGGIWVILLLFELIITSISVEILFRGVLHNTLKEKFGAEKGNGRFLTILIVAIAYSLIYLLFSFPIGIFFLVSNFLIFIFLGVLYEINGNIYNTIFASIFYDIVLIILILYL